jgi:hypothetical protein
MTDENTPAGWGYPTSTARKEHWWAKGEARSGCGGYGRILIETRPDKPVARFVCKACERACDKASGS